MTVSEPTSTFTRRELLREDLLRAQARFREVAQSLAVRGWNEKPANSGWTGGQQLVHLVWALEQLPKEVESAKRGKGMFNLPKWIADPGSYWYCKWTARNATPEAVIRRYDAAIAATLSSLDAVAEPEWELGAAFYGEGFKSVADLFKGPGEHLAEHTTGIDALVVARASAAAQRVS